MAIWKAALTVAAASLLGVNAAAVKRDGYGYGELVDSVSVRVFTCLDRKTNSIIGEFERPHQSRCSTSQSRASSEDCL